MVTAKVDKDQVIIKDKVSYMLTAQGTNFTSNFTDEGVNIIQTQMNNHLNY